MACANDRRGITEEGELVGHADGITEKNATEFVSDLDVVLDEIDVSPLRPHVWLHQEARKLGLPLYSGYIIGLGTHVYKFQGNEFTFEDFMENREDMYDKPTLEFIVDRFFWPRPSYASSDEAVEKMLDSARQSSFPIFGASTYGSQSCLVIRMISDLLGLDQSLGVPKTPVMPRFLKLDALDYTFRVCDLREQGGKKKVA